MPGQRVQVQHVQIVESGFRSVRVDRSAPKDVDFVLNGHHGVVVARRRRLAGTFGLHPKHGVFHKIKAQHINIIRTGSVRGTASKNNQTILKGGGVRKGKVRKREKIEKKTKQNNKKVLTMLFPLNVH
jgi:hypothetical protein